MYSQSGSRSAVWLTGIVAALCALGLLAALMGAAQAQAQGTEPPTCLDPRSDTFAGTALDQQRWDVAREDASLYSVTDGRLRVRTGAGEVQSTETNPGAPNLFQQDVPDGSWTVTTKVNIDHTAEGQQAGLLLAGEGNQDVIKVAYVNKGAPGRWIEFLKIVDGQYDFSGNWNSSMGAGNGYFPADFEGDVWMRLKSDGQVLSGEYSLDGVNWEQIADPRNYEAIEDPTIGVYALHGPAANPSVTADFDYFNLVPASDPFDGTALDPCRWETLRPDPTGLSVGGGELTLRTLRGELSNDESTVKNVILQDAGDSDWQATTKVTIDTTHSGQQAGIVVRGDDRNGAKIVFVQKNDAGGRWIEFLRTTDAATDFTGTWNTGERTDYPDTVWLRLVSAGNELAGYWSADGEDWQKIGANRPITGIEDPQVGLMALSGENDNPPVPARFDFFDFGPGTIVEPPPTEAPDCAPVPDDAEYTTIFDGTQASFDRWEHAGPGYFTLADGAMTSGNDPADPSYGLHWYPVEQYGDFSVRMQWRMTDATDNSGVFVRFPDPGDNRDIPVNQGHEIQINEEGSDVIKTGSIYGFDRENFRNAVAPGEWNDYEITVVGQQYTVCLNGKVVNQYTSTHGRGLRGYIGLQNHDPQSNVSFRNIAVRKLDRSTVQNIFTTVGISTIENRANAGIYGTPSPYAYIAEQMPPSRSVGVGPNDTFDEVPIRMPDTSGTQPNLAAFQGQEYFLAEAQQQAYSRLHFFGATTDSANGQPAGGDFLLTYADGTTETMTVRFRDWANNGGTAADHVAIQTNPRYTRTGTQGNINFNIFHVPKDVAAANRGKTLVSIKLPEDATPKGTVTEAYLMAMTFEDAAGGFENPVLAGDSRFPNDTTPPVSTATVDPGQPNGQGGWYTRPVSLSFAAQDEAGGSQVDRIEYRVDGGAWMAYDGEAVVVDEEGDHTVEYRSLDVAVNVERPKSVAVKIDSTMPEVTAELGRELPEGGQWYDRAVNLTLDGFDGRGSGVGIMEYSIDGGAWTAYTGAVTFDGPGAFSVAYRGTDVAGNAAPAGEPMTVRVDGDAPTTSALLNGAAAVGNYVGSVSVTLNGADAGGSGVAASEYQIDGGAWTAYSGAFTVTGVGTHTVSYRSVDAARNTETARQVAFPINAAGSPPGGGGGGGGGGTDGDAPPAAEPEPWVNVGRPREKDRSVRRLGRGGMRVPIRCASVERGKLRLTVTRRVARTLGLRSRTLASRKVECKGETRATVMLKANRQVRQALTRGRGKIVVALSVRLSGEDGSASDTTLFKLRVGRHR